jgi:hypothetical protein
MCLDRGPTPNRTVRSRFTPPERRFCKPDPPSGAIQSPLCVRAKKIPLLAPASSFSSPPRTATFCIPMPPPWPDRDEKRPKMALCAGPSASDKCPRTAAFCAVDGARRSGCHFRSSILPSAPRWPTPFLSRPKARPTFSRTHRGARRRLTPAIHSSATGAGPSCCVDARNLPPRRIRLTE